MAGGRLSLAGLALVVAGRPGEAALAAGGGEGVGAAVVAAAGGRPLRGGAAGVVASAPVCGLRRSTVTACSWPPMSTVKYLGFLDITRYGPL